MTTNTADNLKFIYIFENKYLKRYFVEVKRVDVKTTVKKDKYFWFAINKFSARNLTFIDSGKLSSGKDIRILGDGVNEYGNDYPWILIFDDKTCNIHRTQWDPSSGFYDKVEIENVPTKVVDHVLDYFEKYK